MFSRVSTPTPVGKKSRRATPLKAFHTPPTAAAAAVSAAQLSAARGTNWSSNVTTSPGGNNNVPVLPSKKRHKVNGPPSVLDCTEAYSIQAVGAVPKPIHQNLSRDQSREALNHGQQQAKCAGSWAFMCMESFFYLWKLQPNPETGTVSSTEPYLEYTVQVPKDCRNIPSDFALLQPVLTIEDGPDCESAPLVSILSPNGNLYQWTEEMLSTGCFKPEHTDFEIPHDTTIVRFSTFTRRSETWFFCVLNTLEVFVLYYSPQTCYTRKLTQSSGLLSGLTSRISQMLFFSSSSGRENSVSDAALEHYAGLKMTIECWKEANENLFKVFFLLNGRLQVWNVQMEQDGDELVAEMSVEAVVKAHFRHKRHTDGNDSVWILDLQLLPSLSSFLVLVGAENNGTMTYSALQFEIQTKAFTSEPKLVLEIPLQVQLFYDISKKEDLLRATLVSSSSPQIHWSAQEDEEVSNCTTQFYALFPMENTPQLCRGVITGYNSQSSSPYSHTCTLLRLAKVTSSSLFGYGLISERMEFYYFSCLLKNGICTVSFAELEAAECSASSPNRNLSHAVRRSSVSPSRAGPTTFQAHEFMHKVLTRWNIKLPNLPSTWTAHTTITVEMVESAIVHISNEILNAKPSTGLRWSSTPKKVPNKNEQDNTQSNYEITPQLIKHQLDEKMKYHMQFVEFVRDVGSCTKSLGGNSFTNLLDEITSAMGTVSENDEKLQAMFALNFLQTQIHQGKSKLNGELLMQAIRKTVARRGFTEEELEMQGLNASDVFYAEVQRLDDFLPIVLEEMTTLRDQPSNHKNQYRSLESSQRVNLLDFVAEVNIVFHCMLDAAVDCRKKLDVQRRVRNDAVPWCFSSQNKALLRKDVELTADILEMELQDEPRSAQTVEVEKEIYRQIVAVGTLLLNSYDQLEQVPGRNGTEDWSNLYEADKLAVLGPLIACGPEYGMETEAVKLCEKYKFFPGLAEICVRNYIADMEKTPSALLHCSSQNDHKENRWKNRLFQYCYQFEDLDFASFLMKWLAADLKSPWQDYSTAKTPPQHQNEQPCRKHSIGLLLSLPSSLHGELHHFLMTHAELCKLAWVHELGTKDYASAHRHLLAEAQHENHSLALKKTFLSIGKLAAKLDESKECAISTHQQRLEEPGTDAVESELLYVRVQEFLRVLPQGTDLERPLSPQQLIQRCLMAMSTRCDEKDLKLSTQCCILALEVLERMQASGYAESEMKMVVMEIWECVILVEENEWKRIRKEYQKNENETEMKECIQRSMLYQILVEYRTCVETDVLRGTGRLTVELMDEMLHVERPEASVLCDQFRALFMKAITLAEWTEE